MSAQSVCADIEKHKADLAAQAERDKTSIGGVFNNLVNKTVGNVTALLNPESYQAKNETEATILTVIRNSIDQKRSMQIEQNCKNAAASSQTNVIDNLSCPICNGGVIFDNDGKLQGYLPLENIKAMRFVDGKDMCSIENVQQINQDEIEQKCKMNAIVTDIMKSQADSQSLAVAKSMQEASGLLSSNSSKTNSCNDIKTDLKQEDYFKYVAECANQADSIQSNTIKTCGRVNNVLQKNSAKKLQECIISNTTTKAMEAKSEIKAESEVISEQKASGLNLFASLASGASCCIIIIIIAIIFFMM